MDERVLQFRVGVVIVVAAIIAGVLVMRFGEGLPWPRPYTIYIQFDRAPGVTVDTPVRKHGVLIGRVARVELQDRGVLVEARIKPQFTLLKSDVCRISTASLLGDAIIDFVPSAAEAPAAETVQPGEYIRGEAGSNPLEVLVDLQGKMSSAIESVETAGGHVTVLADNLNTLITTNQDQFRRVLQRGEMALDDFHRAMSRIQEIAGDPELQGRLKQVVQDLPALFEQAEQLVGDARTTLQSFDRMSRRAEQNLANLEQFTEPLGENGPALVASVARSAENLDRTLRELVQFSEQLNRGDSTLGQLVRDGQLYDKLDRAVTNIEEATRRLRPILDDVRVFTDKIATDPRQLGVKGALDRRPTGVGLKYPVVPLR